VGVKSMACHASITDPAFTNVIISNNTARVVVGSIPRTAVLVNVPSVGTLPLGGGGGMVTALDEIVDETSVGPQRHLHGNTANGGGGIRITIATPDPRYIQRKYRQHPGGAMLNEGSPSLECYDYGQYSSYGHG
jgi:hypothetical protein